MLKGSAKGVQQWQQLTHPLLARYWVHPCRVSDHNRSAICICRFHMHRFNQPQTENIWGQKCYIVADVCQVVKPLMDVSVLMDIQGQLYWKSGFLLFKEVWEQRDGNNHQLLRQGRLVILRPFQRSSATLDEQIYNLPSFFRVLINPMKGAYLWLFSTQTLGQCCMLQFLFPPLSVIRTLRSMFATFLCIFILFNRQYL